MANPSPKPGILCGKKWSLLLDCLQTHIEINISEGFLSSAVSILTSFYDGKAVVLPVKLHGDDNTWCVDRYVVLPENKQKPLVSSDGFWHVASQEYWDWQDAETTYTFHTGDTRLRRLCILQNRTQLALPTAQECLTEQITEKLYRHMKTTLPSIAEYLDCNESHNFDLLCRLEGLSHSTDAWEKNGDLLVQEGAATFRSIPATREDIWNDLYSALTNAGIRDSGLALQVMETARRGLYCSREIPAQLESLLHSLNLPGWYPDYLRKVKYLFPKGHCVASLLIDMLLTYYQIKLEPVVTT